MKKDKSKKANNTDLRNKAEKTLKHVQRPVGMLTDAEARELAHELQVHQVELEMQNEELRKAQIEIEESRSQYSHLYDFAPVGYFTISDEGIILQANLTGAEMLGTERCNLIGKPLSYFVMREDHDAYYLQRNKFRETRDRGTFELRIKRNDGTQFYAQLECAAGYSAEVESAQCLIIMNDITERKEMEETLLQSEKLKSIGIITAGIAHEFNNILAIMMGSAELIEGGLKDENELKKVLCNIIDAGEDGAEIVRNMLKFSKTEGKDTADYIFFDIRHLIDEAIEFAMPRWKNMAQAKGTDYKIDKEDMREVPEVLCNTTELREVFTNIINNALDAMPDGGTLSFSTWSSEDTVFIRISDTGKGMPEDVKKKIFDPFFTTRRPLGTGLGMSVSYGVIVRHGGQIEVESEVGKGTTFNLSIPIKKDVVRKKVMPEPERQRIARKLHILVVDDSEQMCVVVDNFLARDGHTVKAVASGSDAIELAGKEDFDLVLCDLAMPKVYGYDVIKAINKLGKRPKIGIMTGWADNLKPADDVEFKVDFILRKPFKRQELAKHINELFMPKLKD
ncbi:MAG: response regulator [Candidatus Scalindua sp.]|nr:response regulator [Candidatus Scalindua sp.]